MTSPIELAKSVSDLAAAPQKMATKLVIVLGLILALIGIGFVIHQRGIAVGKLQERAGWQLREDARKDDDIALALRHTRDLAALQVKHDSINRENTAHHENKIAQIRRDADSDRRAADNLGGLRIPAAACPAGQAAAGTEAASAGQRDEGPAGTVRLPKQVEDDLWAAANFADEITEQARACQSWIRANGFYGQPQTTEIVTAENVPAVE